MLLLVLPASALVVWNAFQARRDGIERAFASLSGLARVAGLAQQRVLGSARLLLVGLSRSPAVRRGDFGRCADYMGDVRPAVAHLANLGFATRDGNVLCSALPVGAGVNVSDRGYFRRALGNSGFSVGAYMVGRVTGQKSIAFGYPVPDEKGNVVGIAYAAFDLGVFEASADEARLPQGAVILTLDRNGTVLARYPQRPERGSGTLPGAALRAALLGGGEGTLEAMDRDGVRRLYAYASVGADAERALSVAVGLPKSAIVGPIDRALARNLALLAAMLLFALAAAWNGYARWIGQPVRRLLAAGAAMEQGRLDARARGLGPVREFVQIEAAFNRMAESLAQRERRLAGLLEVSADWYWEQDSELRFKEISFNIFERAAIDRDEYVGRRRWETPHFGVSDAQWAEHRAALEAREPFRNFLVGRFDVHGARRYVSISGKPLFDADGAFAGYHGVSSDVTDRVLAEVAMRQSENRYRTLVELSPDAVFTHVDGHILYMNGPGARLYGGRESADLAGKSLRDLVVPAEHARVETRLREILERDAPLPPIEIVQRRLDGSDFVGEVHSKPIDIDGRRGCLTVVRDVTRRRQIEEALRDSEEQYRSLFEKNPYPMWVYRHDDMRFLAVNDAAVAHYGYRREQFLGMTNRDMHPPADLPRLLAAHEHVPETVRDQGHWRHLKKDGTLIDVHIVSYGVRFQGADAHLVHVTDITERLYHEEQIQFLATHDGLTGLPNRNLLADRVLQSLDGARRASRSVALLMFDLDNFKLLNDSFGHHGGDMLLKEVAARISGAVRGGDTVARLGGDEFVVVLGSLRRSEDAADVIEKIRAALAEPFLMEGKEVFVSASIGATLFPDDGEDMASLMRNADVAMYKVKEQGRDGVQFFTPEFSRKAAERIRLEAELRRALERGEFTVYYQPLVHLDTRRIVGAESLVRWRHALRGLVSPGEFIPVMEETGLIVQLGSWMLDQACAQLARWDGAGLPPLALSLNVSARQFRGAALVNEIDEVLARHGLGGARIEIELTESMVMGNAEGFVDVLRSLKELGVGLSIDDFGTGYSSLGYLKRFPIDKLKIDQSFVQDLTEDPNDAAIARTVIALGHSLGVAVVAEGVETRAQLEFFRRHGCDEVQGYYFGKPMPADAFERLVRDGLPPGLWNADR